MAVRTKQSSKLLLWLVAGLFGSGLGGCGKSSDSAPPQEAAPEAKKEPAPKPAAAAPAPKRVTGLDRLHQSFLEATRQQPPPDQRPPDRTMTSKSVGKLYSEVVRLWDTIRFTDAIGNPLVYSAVLETELGNIEIALDPLSAPNHVRNFIALARAGYYDGLVFDRVQHQEAIDPEGATMRYEEIEAGCPLGTGEFGNNSIGYWLKPEFNERFTHVEGTVGACRGIEEDTAACKFYITLGKAPYLDGNYTAFGRVTRGLDVARKIYARPIILDDQDLNGSRRPEKPVVIRKVTIQVRAAGGTS